MRFGADYCQEAASFFKSKVTDGQWEKSIVEVRMPMGKLLSRKVKVKQSTTTLPGWVLH